MPHPTLMVSGQSALLVVDVQEKLLARIPAAQGLVRNVSFLVDAALWVNVPVTATEQYPRGLGPTVAELAQKLPARPDKVGFSCCSIPSVAAGFREKGRAKILVAGIETHVCVLNTALDLLAEGFQVHVAVDAVASRFTVDHDTALRRLEKAGAILTTCETAVFEWLSSAHHPKFKQVSALIQQRMKALLG